MFKIDFLEAFPHLGVQASSCFGQDKIESETSDQCSNESSNQVNNRSKHINY